MKGYILLEGGAEFGGQMAAPDRRAIELAGGHQASICIIPTAAAPDNNHERAGNNGRRWFENLGATNVTVLPLIDKSSADDKAIAEALTNARLIYLLGGFTHYLGQTLRDSVSWQAIEQAHQAGAVIAGSSAGAMVLCEHYYNPTAGEVVTGLGLVPNACVLPHYNTFGQRWVDHLQQQLPGVTLIGIDERTGMIDDQPNGAWSVHGQGAITLHTVSQAAAFANGSTLSL